MELRDQPHRQQCAR